MDQPGLERSPKELLLPPPLAQASRNASVAGGRGRRCRPSRACPSEGVEGERMPLPSA